MECREKFRKKPNGRSLITVGEIKGKQGWSRQRKDLLLHRVM
jgi:hypothetical protein